jgi:hypothetical protein
MQLNKKLRDVVAALALSLSQLSPYSAQAATKQPKVPSGIEAIVESSIPETNAGQYRLLSSYGNSFDSLYRHLNDYLKQHAEDKEDTTKMVPLKWLNVLPPSVLGGILGFTYLGGNSIWIRDDLTGETKEETDTHESSHTPDEYETKVITWWILSGSESKYLK